VRITAQLIRTSDGTHLWSERYDRQLTDVFQIQDEIAGEVVKALQLALPVSEQKRLTDKRTENVAAYQEYLRGNALLVGRRVSEMRQSLTHFERAIELDPGYAGAHAAAGMTLGLLRTYSGNLTDDERTRQRRHIDEALRLNPNLGEAYAARAYLHQNERDIAAAEADYRRATELSPNFATAYLWYALFLQSYVNDIERALPLMRRALELDPLSPIIRNYYALALAADDRMDEALEANAQLLRDHPKFSEGYATRANLLEAKGDLVGALRSWDALLKLDPAALGRLQSRCGTMALFGALDEAEACLDKVAKVLGEAELVDLRWDLMVLRGQYEKAYLSLALQPNIQGPDARALVRTQEATGRYKEGLALLMRLSPELFEQPPRLASNPPWAVVMAGGLLLGTGDTTRGRDLLRRALKANASRPYVAYLGYGRDWNDVLAWTALGDMKQACKALGDAVSAGQFLRVGMLAHLPQLAELRKQPCFEIQVAPARAKEAAQREAARKAGLL
jgi:tetratricopeptide (TPR) repeat protein